MKKIFLALMIMLPVVGKSADAGTDAGEKARLQSMGTTIQRQLCIAYAQGLVTKRENIGFIGSIPKNYQFIVLFRWHPSTPLVVKDSDITLLQTGCEGAPQAHVDTFWAAVDGDKESEKTLNVTFLQAFNTVREWRKEVPESKVDLHVGVTGAEISAETVLKHAMPTLKKKFDEMDEERDAARAAEPFDL